SAQPAPAGRLAQRTAILDAQSRGAGGDPGTVRRPRGAEAPREPALWLARRGAVLRGPRGETVAARRGPGPAPLWGGGQRLSRRLPHPLREAPAPAHLGGPGALGALPDRGRTRGVHRRRRALARAAMKMIMMSGWFVRFMGSHLSTEADAGRAL